MVLINKMIVLVKIKSLELFVKMVMCVTRKKIKTKNQICEE